MALQDAAPRADDYKVQLPCIHPVVHRRSSDPEHFSDFIDAVKPLVHRAPPAVVCQLWRRIRQLTVPVNCLYWVSIESVRLCVHLCTIDERSTSSSRSIPADVCLHIANDAARVSLRPRRLSPETIFDCVF